jgi:hypothetical protein
VDRLKARLASRNPGKARELEHLLPTWTIEPLGADDFPPEDGETYYENARGKALFGRAHAHEDEWSIGEDSGIEVDALDGGPGVHSACPLPVRSFAAAARSRGGSVSRLTAAKGSASIRSSSRTVEIKPLPSWATTGNGRTHIARMPPTRCSQP